MINRVLTELKFVLGKISVWIVGSSIIKHAFVQARGRPDGIHLGLEQHGVSVWWQGRSGLSATRLKSTFNLMRSLEDDPSILVIHCGANDLGMVPLKKLRNYLRTSLAYIHNNIPRALLVWSQLLPRFHWRYSNNNKAMKEGLVRLNSCLSTYVLSLGGGYIKYPEIVLSSPELFASDGVHLSTLGTDIFLNTLQGGLETFITSASSVFPNMLT